MIIPISNKPLRTFKNKNYTDKVCLDPFNTIEIGINGDVRLCGCGEWMPTAIGNIYEHSIEELLDNPIARNIRESIRDGSFVYCNENTCGRIVNNNLFLKKDLEWTVTQTRMPDGTPTQVHGYELYKDESSIKLPDTYYIAGDRICNLSCPSCRTEVLGETVDEREEKNNLFNQLNENLFGGSSTKVISIHVSTTGEIFSSRLLFNFLKFFPVDRYPNAEFWLQTNGLLLSRKWDELKHLENNIKNITVTTDSCVPDTYEKLRRGGKFDDIVKNMQYIQNLKKRIKFEFINRMVIQLDNHDQITDFYNWSKSFDVDVIEFMKFQSWSSAKLSPEQFVKMDVLNHDHEKYKITVDQLQSLKSKYQNQILFFGFNMGC